MLPVLTTSMKIFKSRNLRRRSTRGSVDIGPAPLSHLVMRSSHKRIICLCPLVLSEVTAMGGKCMPTKSAISFAILTVASGFAGEGSAAAQDWPTRPLTMVITAAAGGGPDAIGRILASRLSEILGRQVIVENIGGAGGLTGTARVAKAAPDGYQFVLGITDNMAQL